MEYMEFDNIVNAVKGKVVKKSNNTNYNEVCTDTRKIEKGNIFIALRGENFNGAKFAKEASKKGASICIVDEIDFNINEISEDTSIILVQNGNSALLDLAEYYRSMLSLKIVAITGSTGKTSTKDITAAVLSGKYRVFKTQGNFNNEIGLPLMILSLNNSYDIAVLEMGMSNFNEIHNMVKAARPDVALMTNIGISHIENLKTKENILKAKMEITDYFDEKNVLLINGNDDMLSKISNSTFRVVKTGIERDMEYSASELSLTEDSAEFNLLEKSTNTNFQVKLPIPGRHNVQNALLAFACGRHFNMNFEEMQNGLKNLVSTSMRMDIVKNDNFTIVNDCYNASPDSMIAAIEVIKTINGGRKIAVFGTMRELGDESSSAHEKVANYAANNGIDVLIVYSEYETSYKKGFANKEFYSFKDTKEISSFLKKFIDKNDVILVKASRAMKFENIVNALKNSDC